MRLVGGVAREEERDGIMTGLAGLDWAGGLVNDYYHWHL